MLTPLKTHVQAIKDAELMMLDETYPEYIRVALLRQIKDWVENFTICDGYVSRIHKMEWRVDDGE